MRLTKKKVPIYFGRLDIVISKDFKKSADTLGMKWDQFDVSLYDAFTYQRRSKKGYSRYVVFLKPNCTAKVVAHEATHIVNYIFNDVHVKADSHNDEPFAYLLGWVVGEIHKSLKK